MIKKNKNIRRFIFVCIAIIIALIDKSPLVLDERIGTEYLNNSFYLMYDGILNKTLGAPYEYRILMPNFIKFLSYITGITPLNIAIILNVLLIYCTLILFAKYAKQYVNPFIALLSAIILAFYILIFQTQILGIIVAESQDMLNLVFILSLLLLAKKEQWILFSVLLAISIFNRETPLILLLPFSYLLFKRKNIKVLIGINLVGFSAYFLIRYFIDVSHSDYPNFNNLRTNFPGYNMVYFKKAIEFNLHLIVFLLPLLYLSFLHFKTKKIESKVIILTSIPFMIIHYLMGSIIELRLFLPLFILLLPIAMYNLKRNFDFEQ